MRVCATRGNAGATAGEACSDGFETTVDETRTVLVAADADRERAPSAAWRIDLGVSRPRHPRNGLGPILGGRHHDVARWVLDIRIGAGVDRRVERGDLPL